MTQNSIDYNKYRLLGTYAEEGIITNLAYELQGSVLKIGIENTPPMNPPSCQPLKHILQK